MKAMILAAGLGTRLKPLTDRIPKALVEIEGVPMLERIITTLHNQGFREIVINVHHFAGQIIDFLEKKKFEGMDISISDEREKLLDTGGGIVNAFSKIFKNNDQPVLIHNVDILSNANLGKLVRDAQNDSLLLVSERNSSRKLCFDTNMELKGWHDLKNNKWLPETYSSVGSQKELAFSGIYILSKSAIEEMRDLLGEGKFPVMDYFLHTKRCEKIIGKAYDNLKVLDIGKPETLIHASEFI